MAFAVLFRFAGKKLDGKKLIIKKHTFDIGDLFFKALSVILFLLFMLPFIFYEGAKKAHGARRGTEQNQIGLTAPTTPDPDISTRNYYMFAPAQTVLIALLKWFTLMMTAVLIVMPFFKKREAKDFSVFVAPVITILNVIFFRQIAKTIIYYPDNLGVWEDKYPGSGLFDSNPDVNLFHWRIIIYACLIALMGAISFERLLRFIMEKDFTELKKRFGKLALFVLFYMIAFMPVYVPQLFFGYAGSEPKGFKVSHRLLIYLTLGFPFCVQFLFKKKSYEERRYLLVMLALSGFIEYFSHYFYPGKTIISSLPLHLCNTAIALMFFAYVFNIKGIFYFTYLVNIMGAMMALILPTTEGAFTRMGNICFFYNHIYAIVLPFLGVSLRVFDRPNMKLMRKAIGFFTIYVLFAATMDAWFNNSTSLQPVTLEYNARGHINIDYFFLYSDFFVNKSIFGWAQPLKANFILRFRIGDTMMTYHYIYIMLVYVISIALMFAFWGIYGTLYKVEDSHKELARRKKLMKVDKTNLLKELDGRSPKEPLHPEGAHMIKISHFSKTYAGSDRKAVTDLNLEIHEGEVFGFIGHNGAGKSTTIKSLVGIQTITEGSIEIQGYDIARQPLEAKLNMGYVSDNHAVYEKLTGREYIGYVADLYMVNEEDKNARIKKYGEMFGLTDALDREIKSYSHGMKQKLMVISALIHNPKVWVLDEPLTGLDPTSSYQIKECMRQHANEGNIVFFSSHVIEVVEKICDRVAIISGGKLCRVCTPEEIAKEGKSLEELYLKYATEGADAEKKESESEENADGLNAPAQETEAEAPIVQDGDNND